MAITFLYYRDLPRAVAFYRDVMGFRPAIDQGALAQILHIAGDAHVGLVDEARGMNRWQAEKCVQLCIRVSDLDAWHDHLDAHGVEGLTAPRVNRAIGIRAFVLRDPEGYQIEVQEALGEAP
jgi:catechol 2,3-dioxygenase-like lactoylglutathione lyase family enzyme